VRVANSNQETQSISIGTHNEMFFVAAMQLLFIDCSRRFVKLILLSHAQIDRASRMACHPAVFSFRLGFVHLEIDSRMQSSYG